MSRSGIKIQPCGFQFGVRGTRCKHCFEMVSLKWKHYFSVDRILSCWILTRYKIFYAFAAPRAAQYEARVHVQIEQRGNDGKRVAGCVALVITFGVLVLGLIINTVWVMSELHQFINQSCDNANTTADACDCTCNLESLLLYVVLWLVNFIIIIVVTTVVYKKRPQAHHGHGDGHPQPKQWLWSPPGLGHRHHYQDKAQLLNSGNDQV